MYSQTTKKVRVYYEEAYLLKRPLIMGVFSVFVDEEIQSLRNDSAAITGRIRTRKHTLCDPS